MKKVFLTTILCFILCVCTFGFMGCGEGNHSKDDIDSLYASMKTNSQTAQFFDGNNLTVQFDSTKIDVSETDKSYIFPQVYDYYLKSSSALFTNIINRVGKISYVVKNFNQEQLNTIYNNLSSVKSNMLSLAESKKVFEVTEGNLHYKNVISAYNRLISSLYTLNDNFADYYFVSNIGYVDFSKTENSLNDSNVRDMISYQLLQTSKVSYNYELLNFMYTNPLGEIKTWYNSTVTLKSFISLAKTVIAQLENTENLALFIGTNSDSVKQIFANMQIQEREYIQEYSNFIRSVNNFAVKSYFASTNKPAYLESISYQKQSYFQIIQNFLSGRYIAYTTGLQEVINYI
ncbi:MAG: hypothetical protein IJW32_03880 [Clostridia bacterium]|nr:hypothetical protein [Clostridia bacterium]